MLATLSVTRFTTRCNEVFYEGAVFTFSKRDVAPTTDEAPYMVHSSINSIDKVVVADGVAAHATRTGIQHPGEVVLVTLLATRVSTTCGSCSATLHFT